MNIVKTIYEQSIGRLKSATATGYFDDNSLTAPVDHAWFEGQPDQATVTEDNKLSYPFDCPAVFYQFSKEMEFTGPPNRRKFSGELTLHVVQSRIGKDGLEGDGTHADFKALTAYAEALISLLDGYRLPCTATLRLAGHTTDHVNHGLFIDLLRFTFDGSWNKPTVTEL